jgi:hypothetical protein
MPEANNIPLDFPLVLNTKQVKRTISFIASIFLRCPGATIENKYY